MEARLEQVSRSLGAWLRAAYPTLVTALASGLLVLLLWPQSPRIYLAEATASASVLQPPGDTADDAIRWLHSDEVLRAAIANLRATQPQNLAAFTAGSSASDPIAAVRDRLQLVCLASPDEMPRVAIGCQASRKRAALALVTELGQQLADHYAQQRKRGRLANLEDRERQVQEELQAAAAARERLEVELQGLRHAQLTSAVASAQIVHPAPLTAQVSSPDHRRSELTRSLESLKLERDRLLEVYLPAHPQIQTLSAQISRLEETLRRYIPEPEEADSTEPPQREVRAGSKVLLQWRRDPGAHETLASGQESLAAADPRSGELMAAIRATQLDLLAATQRRAQAEQTRRALDGERQQIEAEGDLAWSVQPAHIVSTEGGSQARQQLAAGLIAASLGGLSAVWLGRRVAQDRPLATAAEVRSRFALPVLGTVASADDESTLSAGPTPWESALHFIRRSSEVVLLTFVLTLLAAAALDRSLLGEMVQDPLETLGELMQRLL